MTDGDKATFTLLQAITVYCPESEQHYTIDRKAYRAISEQERRRVDNVIKQLANYGKVLMTLLTRLIDYFPMAVFYLLLMSYLASDLRAAPLPEQLSSLLQFLPSALALSLFGVIFAVAIDYTVTPSRYGLRGIIAEQILARVKEVSASNANQNQDRPPEA